MTTGQAKYAVQFCAHDSRWEPEKPEFVYTLEQAEAIRAEWKARADTVGGDVLITKEEKTPQLYMVFYDGNKKHVWPLSMRKGDIYY